MVAVPKLPMNIRSIRRTILSLIKKRVLCKCSIMREANKSDTGVIKYEHEWPLFRLRDKSDPEWWDGLMEISGTDEDDIKYISKIPMKEIPSRLPDKQTAFHHEEIASGSVPLAHIQFYFAPKILEKDEWAGASSRWDIRKLEAVMSKEPDNDEPNTPGEGGDTPEKEGEGTHAKGGVTPTSGGGGRPRPPHSLLDKQRLDFHLSETTTTTDTIIESAISSGMDWYNVCQDVVVVSFGYKIFQHISSNELKLIKANMNKNIAPVSIGTYLSLLEAQYSMNLDTTGKPISNPAGIAISTASRFTPSSSALQMIKTQADTLRMAKSMKMEEQESTQALHEDVDLHIAIKELIIQTGKQNAAWLKAEVREYVNSNPEFAKTPDEPLYLAMAMDYGDRFDRNIAEVSRYIAESSQAGDLEGGGVNKQIWHLESLYLIDTTKVYAVLKLFCYCTFFYKKNVVKLYQEQTRTSHRQ